MYNNRSNCNNCNNNNNCNNCNNKSGCGCDSLAIAFVKWQKWQKPLCAGEGLSHGTIFPDLILPFYGCRPNNYQGGIHS